MQPRLRWLLVVLTLVTGAGLYFSFQLLISNAERSIQAAASSRGLDLKWDRLSWSLDGVSVHNISGEHETVSVSIDELQIKFSAFEWHGSRPRIGVIDVVEAHVTLKRRGRDSQGVPTVIGPSKNQVLGLKTWTDLGVDLVRFHGSTLIVRDKTLTLLESEIIDGHIDLSTGDPSFQIASRYRTAWTEYGTAMLSGMYRAGAQFQQVLIAPMVAGERLLELKNGADRYALGQVMVNLKTDDLAASELIVKTVSLKRGHLSAQIDQVKLSGGLSQPMIQIQGADLSVARRLGSTRVTRVMNTPSLFLSLPTIKLPELLHRFFDFNGRLHWTQLAIKIGERRPVLLDDGRLGRDRVDVSLSLGGQQLELALDWDGASGLIHTIQWATKGLQLGSLVDTLAFHRPLSDFSRLGLEGVVSGQGTVSIVGDAISQQRLLIFDAHSRLDAGQIDWSAVSPTPLSEVRLNVSGSGAYDTALDSANMNIGLSSGPLHMDVTALYRGYGRHRRLELVGSSKEVACQTAIHTLPTGLLGGYSKIRLSGRMKPWFRFRWPFAKPNMIRLKFRDIISGCRVDALNADSSVWPKVTFTGKTAPLDDVDWLKKRFVLTLDEGVYGGASIQVGPGTKSFHSIRRMPKHVGGAAYLSEEILFPRNNPIDRGLISRALRLNLLGRRFVYGGSTVTQQLVKNLFLTRDKSIARKVQEVLIAKRITQEISRRRVLELYLNCIEFGRNVYGISRAAYYYFQRSPSRLRPRESIFLAMIKPAPRHAPRMRRRGRTPPFSYWQARAEVILERLIKHDFVSPDEAKLERPLDIEWTKGRYLEPERDPSDLAPLDDSP
ncbi:MAG: hypothetical protein CMH52_12975 [Myxococcales bacterium]|nr:hypothetical protein [Myxococcales bacterium]